VDQSDKSGRTALHWAAISGHKEAAELLVANGAFVASRRCMYEIIKERSAMAHNHTANIHTPGANVMAETASKMTPLHGAAEGGRAEVVQILMDGAGGNKEALFNARDADGHTPFELAMQNKHSGVVKLLKELGDPNAQSASCSVM